MFPLGVITDEITQDFEVALDRMVEWEIPYAEIRGLWGRNVVDLEPDELKKARSHLDDRGLKACGIATPFYKCELSGSAASETGRLHLARDRTLDEQIEVLRRCARACQLFNTPNLRVFAFWRRGETTPAIVERIVELFHEPLRIAREEGVTLLLENEHDCYMSSGAEMAPVLDRLAGEGLRAVWDPGNEYVAGVNDPYPSGYEALKPHIEHIHLKDPRKDPDGTMRWVPMGAGDVDYEGLLIALNRDGYPGVLSIETHYIPKDGSPEQGTRETVRGIRSLFERIAGD